MRSKLFTRRLGVHTSIAGGLSLSLKRAGELGCTTMQMFSHNPRGWQLSDIDPGEAALFRSLKKELDIKPVFIHSSYLINVASADSFIREKSVLMLEEELRRADVIGAEYVIMHAGALDSGSPDSAIITINSIKRVLKGRAYKAGLLLENTAGGEGADYIKLLGLILKKTGAAGICLDTCHAFAAGTDIRTQEGLRALARELRAHIGINKVKGIHLNDSKGTLGSRIDRHEHIGKGKIGMAGMREFLHFKPFGNIPLILETPRDNPGDDPKNLKTVRELIS
jgi:deoxyribonuclease-4